MADVTPHSISGYVYADVNDNGIMDPVEMGLPNVPVTLTGSEERTVLTGADGRYVFAELAAGTYHVKETQPLAFIDGIDTPGSPLLGGVEGDFFHDVELERRGNSCHRLQLWGTRAAIPPGFTSTAVGFAATLQRADRPTGHHGRFGWGTFTADYYGTLTLTAESESGRRRGVGSLRRGHVARHARSRLVR